MPHKLRVDSERFEKSFPGPWTRPGEGGGARPRSPHQEHLPTRHPAPRAGGKPGPGPLTTVASG